MSYYNIHIFNFQVKRHYKESKRNHLKHQKDLNLRVVRAQSSILLETTPFVC